MNLHLSWVFRHRKRHLKLAFSDALTLFLPDVVCGILLYVLVTFVVAVPWWKSSPWPMRTTVFDQIGSKLHQLLTWLHGAPAGLKLNSPLNDFLGYFYSYHVFIWTNYVDLLASYTTPCLIGKLLLLSSFFGLSLPISLVSDSLLVVFPHMICFYVYATKLYRMELRMLLVCFRLFRGQKWNPLRNRVDSVRYDFEQLFVGTLLFTLALFLFPTCLVYYVVFLALYLPLVLVRYFLFVCCNFLVRYPFYLLILRIFSNKLFLSEEKEGDNSVTLVSLTEVHRLVEFSFSENLPSFSDIFKAILNGEVVAL